MEQTQGWSRDFAVRVGQRVAHLRARLGEVQGRKFTTQALADRTAELGHPMDRSVLAKLEKGHRHTITVPELFVLARALDVPPLLLVVPLGHAEKVEILPGSLMSTTDAMHWLRGEGSSLAGLETDDPTVSDFVAHDVELSRWGWAVDLGATIRAGEMEGTAQDVERHDADAERARTRLQNIRRAMRDRGEIPPPVPPGLRLEESRRP